LGPELISFNFLFNYFIIYAPFTGRVSCYLAFSIPRGAADLQNLPTTHAHWGLHVVNFHFTDYSKALKAGLSPHASGLDAAEAANPGGRET